jgi:hypothetical protein
MPKSALAERGFLARRVLFALLAAILASPEVDGFTLAKETDMAPDPASALPDALSPPPLE